MVRARGENEADWSGFSDPDSVRNKIGKNAKTFLTYLNDFNLSNFSFWARLIDLDFGRRGVRGRALEVA